MPYFSESFRWFHFRIYLISALDWNIFHYCCNVLFSDNAGNKLTEQSLKAFLSSLEGQGEGGLLRLSLNVSIIILFLENLSFLKSLFWFQLCFSEESVSLRLWHLPEDTGNDVSQGPSKEKLLWSGGGWTQWTQDH